MVEDCVIVVTGIIITITMCMTSSRSSISRISSVVALLVLIAVVVNSINSSSIVVSLKLPIILLF